MPSSASRHVKVLDRRGDHLARRIAEAGNGRLTFDEAELDALTWAIGRLRQICRLCRFCNNDASAKMAGDWICDECMQERRIGE